MKVKDAYRHFLKNGMTSMLSVSIHLFSTVGNGWEWKDGELNPQDPLENWYEGPKPRLFTATNPSLRNKYQLLNEVEAIKWKFVCDNLEIILESPVDSNLFGSEHHINGSWLKNPSIDYANLWTFPETITKEWAEAIVCFSDWWTQSFRLFYGVGRNGNTDFWDEKVKMQYNAIENAMKRAYKIAYGISFDEQMEEVTKILLEI